MEQASIGVEGILQEMLDTEHAYRQAIRACQEHAPGLFRHERARLGWTQVKMADALRIDVTYLSKIENGKLVAGKPVLHKFLALLRSTEVYGDSK